MISSIFRVDICFSTSGSMCKISVLVSGVACIVGMISFVSEERSISSFSKVV